MKIKLILVIMIFFSCVDRSKKIPKEIIPVKKFTQILKDVHIIEAKHDLLKQKNIIYKKTLLTNDYDSIYIKHNIIEDSFKKSLDYYAEKPEYLEKIYSDILTKLEEENINSSP